MFDITSEITAVIIINKLYPDEALMKETGGTIYISMIGA